MNCPYCQKEIEDRWIYPIGMKLFRKGLHNSFHNVEVVGHALSTEGFPVYLVRDIYQLNKDDKGEKREYLTVVFELSQYTPTSEPLITIPKKEYEDLKLKVEPKRFITV